MTKKTSFGKLEFKFASTDTGAGTLSGYGAVFSNVDGVNDVIVPGAFTKTLADFKAKGSLPAMLFNHQLMSMPVGVWTSMVEDQTGLKCEGEFIDTAAGRDAYAAVKAGALDGLSITYEIVAGRESIVDGQAVRLITECKLWEVSIVTFPCNDLARISDVKMENIMDDEELLKSLIAKGMDADAAQALLKSFDDDDTEEDDLETKYNEAVLSALNHFVEHAKEKYGR